MKKRIAALTAAAILLLIASSVVSVNPTRTDASGAPPPAAEISTRDGPQPGQVVVSWKVVPEATHYRIAHVNLDDFQALRTANPTASWRQTVVFAEMAAKDITRTNGRMEFAVKRLENGVNHAFTVLTSNDAGWDRSTVHGTFVWSQNPTWRNHTAPSKPAFDNGEQPPQPQPQPTPTPTAVPTAQPTPQTTPPPAAQPTPQAKATPVPTPTPKYHLLPGTPADYDPFVEMLTLINEARSQAGAQPVEFGENPAAQLHAEDMLANCFISHWGTDGLKPNMRYTLTGGHQTNGENDVSSGLCYSPNATHQYIEHVVPSAFEALMESRGHRRTILNRHYAKVNLGIATNNRAFFIVQHFEADYVRYDQPPTISDNILSFSGSANIPPVDHQEDMNLKARVFYDPPPHTLTPRQLSSTFGYGVGAQVASLHISDPCRDREPDEPYCSVHILDRYYGPDPYDAPAGPPITTDDEHRKLIRQARDAAPTLETDTVYRINASHAEINGTNFAVEADLTTILEERGAGVYTILLDASYDGPCKTCLPTNYPLSEYAIFHGVTPPAKYAAAARQ